MPISDHRRRGFAATGASLAAVVASGIGIGSGSEIRTLGKRVPKLGANGFFRREDKFTKMTEGDTEFGGVRDVGFTGRVAAEVGGGDETRWREIAANLARAFHGDHPRCRG